jgi:hypothetical protein
LSRAPESHADAVGSKAGKEELLTPQHRPDGFRRNAPSIKKTRGKSFSAEPSAIKNFWPDLQSFRTFARRSPTLPFMRRWGDLRAPLS